MSNRKGGIDAAANEVMRIPDASPDTPAMKAQAALNQAQDAGGGVLREQYLRQAQRQIAAIDAAANSKIVQQLQAQVLALQGRGGDTKIAHVTPGEVVLSKRMQTPEVMRALADAARDAGIDPATLFVGSDRNAINPRTGQAEFADPLTPPQGDMETVTVSGRRLPPLTDDDVNLLGRMIFTEGAGDYRKPSLLQALGSTALNRQGAPRNTDSINQIINQPKQFQGVGLVTAPSGDPSLWTLSANPDQLTGPNKAAYAAAQNVARGLADGSLSDNTDGAVRFGSGPGNGVMPEKMQSDVDNGTFERSRDDIGNWAFLRPIKRPPR